MSFGADDPLDQRGRADCARLRWSVSREAQVAPERSAIETAELTGCAGPIDSKLSSIDLGSWAGLAPEQVDPMELGSWLMDPDFASHGGESVTAFVARLADWLKGCADSDSIAVVTSGTAQGLVAAALACDFWSVEVAPAQVVNLSRRGGRWRVRIGC
nr:histidine phosphatase family protein [Nocardia sp. 348MFTsu5.1]